MNKVIAVCEYGWIIIGEKKSQDSKLLVLENSSVVRRWSNGKGIGGLAKEKNKEEYKLDEIGNVEIMTDKIGLEEYYIDLMKGGK